MSKSADHDGRAWILTAACTVLCTTTKTNPILIVGGAAFIGWLGWVGSSGRTKNLDDRPNFWFASSLLGAYLDGNSKRRIFPLSCEPLFKATCGKC
jgi:hypothetical protein